MTNATNATNKENTMNDKRVTIDGVEYKLEAVEAAKVPAANRNYLHEPYNLYDIAEAGGYEVIDNYDFNWYCEDKYDDADASEVCDDCGLAVCDSCGKHTCAEGGNVCPSCAGDDWSPVNAKKVVISRHIFDIDADYDTTPADHRIVGFETHDGKQFLVTYADGYGFEFTDRVEWANILSVLYTCKRANAQHVFLDMLQYLRTC